MKRKSLSLMFTGLLAISTLLLASCGGTSSSSQQPPPANSYVLTVSAPASGAGKIVSSSGGINCPGTCSASFAQGTQVTLTETPGTNYVFGGWSGSCTGMATCTVTMTAAESVTAAFNAEDGLTVTIAGGGSGTVMSSPGGISCSPTTPNTCTATFPPNTAVQLTETPAANNTFAGWGGACSGTGACSVTVTTSANVTATFTASSATAALTVTLAGTGKGSVASSPTGISCPGTCTGTFATGTQITLTETPGANSSFTSWTGCTGATACVLTLSGTTTVTATFGPTNPYAALNHIILFAQENRSLDHYFGYMRQYWANNSIPDQSFDGLPQFNPAVESLLCMVRLPRFRAATLQLMPTVVRQTPRTRSRPSRSTPLCCLLEKRAPCVRKIRVLSGTKRTTIGITLTRLINLQKTLRL